MSNFIFHAISENMPGLESKLARAGIRSSSEAFIKKTMMSTFYLSTGIMLCLGIILMQLNVGFLVITVMYVLFMTMMFFYMLRVPDAKIAQQQKEINKELIFLGRFIVIEMEAGVPLYQVMKNVSKSFDLVGNTFQDMVNKIDMGTSMEDAMEEVIETTASSDLRKILWQLLNVVRTGSDVITSLNLVIEQVMREQMIEVTGYGKKLNPLAMFYMIIAVIMPSLGIIMLIVVSAFMEIKFTLPILLTISGLLGFVQFMFLAMIKSSRPAVEL